MLKGSLFLFLLVGTMILLFKSSRFIFILIGLEFLVFSSLTTLSNGLLFIFILVLLVISSIIGMLVFLIMLNDFGKDLSLI